MKRSRRGSPWIISVILAALGVVLIGVSVSNGDMMEMWQKAINICLECIGVG